MTASMIFCVPMLVAGVLLLVVSCSLLVVSVDVHNTVPVSSWISESIVIPLKISDDTSWIPVVAHRPVPKTVPSPVKTYPSVGIFSCPRKFCAIYSWKLELNSLCT